MAYEQIQSGLSAEEARRKALRQKIVDAMSGMGETQMVSGRAVPFSPVTGISKIVEALINKGSMGESQAETERLLGQQAEEKQAAIEDVMGLYSGVEGVEAQPQIGGPLRYGEGEQYQEFQPQVEGVKGIEADPVKAALLAASSPYTKDMSSIISSQGAGAKPYYKPVYGKGGEVLSFDARTGTMQPTNVVAAKFDPETRGAVKGAEEQYKQDVLLEMEPKKAAAVDIAEREAEKVIDQPKIESGLAAGLAKTEMLDSTIDQAIDQAGTWTSGFLGATTSWVPGTPAYDLGKTLDTVRANIGFDKLQEMRANSPTGGALGQVSERENTLLQSVWSSVEQSQSEEQLKANLEKVRQQVKESWERVRDAYEKDYGVPYGAEQKAPETDIDALLNKY